MYMWYVAHSLDLSPTGIIWRSTMVVNELKLISVTLLIIWGWISLTSYVFVLIEARTKYSLENFIEI